VSELRARRDSVLAQVGNAAAPDAACATVPDPEPLLVSNTTLHDFRMILSQTAPVNGAVALSAAEQDALRCADGDAVRTLSLNSRKNPHV